MAGRTPLHRRVLVQGGAGLSVELEMKATRRQQREPDLEGVARARFAHVKTRDAVKPFGK